MSGDAETKTVFSGWIRNNLATILVPLLSFTLALIVSWGTSIREEEKLLARITQMESTIATLEAQDKEFNDDQDELEDQIRDVVRGLTTAINTTSRNVENMVIREGRDLERTMIRIDSRVDNLARRMALFDGIGAAPAFGPQPSFSMESAEDLLPDEYILDTAPVTPEN